jgi:hypothetical protein
LAGGRARSGLMTARGPGTGRDEAVHPLPAEAVALAAAPERS